MTDKQSIIAKFQRATGDTGSTEVQCAIYTARISEISEHCNKNPHDFQSRRGLIHLVNRRKRLLSYLRRIDEGRYITLMKELQLRIKKES